MPPRPEKNAQKHEVIAFPQPPGSRAVWLAGVLRQRLWGGAYRPDQWIREHALRTEFGLSNGPVREALQLLVGEGLFERVPYCGIRVCALSDDEVVELFQLRLGLFELAAELAARRRDPAVMARAPSVLDQVRHNLFVTPGPTPGHLTGWVLEASGNRQLQRSWERVAGLARLYVYESVRRAADPEGMNKFAEELIAAIVAGKPVQAKKAVRNLTARQIKDLGLDLQLD